MPPPSPRPRPRRTPSLTSLTNLAANPPPITHWPSILPPSGTLTPLLSSTNPKHKIQALSTVIALLSPSKKFIEASLKTTPSTTAFTTPASIAITAVTAISNLLPSLLLETHPIALAKTARLAAELSSCGVTTPQVARRLYDIVLDDHIDRTSRAAAASALVHAVCKGDTDLICDTFSTCLSNHHAPVAEMLAVLRVAVMESPKRFLPIWRNAGDVLIRVLSDAAIGLHAVRLVQGFVTALLENGDHQSADSEDVKDAENGKFVDETIDQLLPTVYESILVPAALSEDQPMQLSAIAATDAFQQLSLTKTHDEFGNILDNVRVVLRRLSKDATIPVRSAALKALGNHPVHFEEILTFVATTPATPRLLRAKAFSAAAVLLEEMVIDGLVTKIVEGLLREAIEHLSFDGKEMTKAEKTAHESLRVACLAFLGVAVARWGEWETGMLLDGVEDAFSVVMRTAQEGNVNVRVHACKSLGRVLKNRTGDDQTDIVNFLCSMLAPSVPVRVIMASARALTGMKDITTLQIGQRMLLVEQCVRCSKAKEGIGDTQTQALRQALRRLLGELAVRVIQEGPDWSCGSVELGDVFDCVAAYYRLPVFFKSRFEEGYDHVFEDLPEEARSAVRCLLEARDM